MEKRDLLFEIGTEELPPNSLNTLSQALEERVCKGLHDNDLNFDGCYSYATPRRLALKIQNLDIAQQDRIIEKKGPAIKAAYDVHGKATKAAIGFAQSCKTDVDKLFTIKTEKGEWLGFRETLKGSETHNLIPNIINTSLSKLPIAKKMRWGASEVEFVRPVHWVVLLFGNQILKSKILDIEADNLTYGHRFHSPGAIKIVDVNDYEMLLRSKGKVIANYKERKELIREQVQKVASEVNGRVNIDDDLLNEVTSLTELPVPILGEFEKKYLDLPPEVLITTMQVNQKYFAVMNNDYSILPYFITLSNLESTNPESIKKGNERVVKPRLADAEFFWNKDKKKSLHSRINDLEKLIFQNKLGSMAAKTRRLEEVSKYMCMQLSTDEGVVERAAQLSKSDLLTEIVGEFPSLQGLMGKYYALSDGESNEIAVAIEEQYYPKQSGGKIPASLSGQILSVAEKIDTIVGIFSIGLVPTGNKDPYALRRAAFGLLRILIEAKLEIDLLKLIDFSLDCYDHEFNKEETKDAVFRFITDRLKSYCIDLGFTVNEFDSVYAVNPTNPLDFIRRVNAVKTFKELPESSSLAAANKRINNLIKKMNMPAKLDKGNLKLLEEVQLYDHSEELRAIISRMINEKDYQSALKELSKLNDDVNAFFDNVMVMCDDLDLRSSRVALLQQVSNQFLLIADISRLPE